MKKQNIIDKKSKTYVEKVKYRIIFTVLDLFLILLMMFIMKHFRIESKHRGKLSEKFNLHGERKWWKKYTEEKGGMRERLPPHTYTPYFY